MSQSLARFLFWLPRIVGVLFAVFLSLFALDVFGMGLDAGQTILALAMHLIPTFLFLIILAVAWRWEAVGGAVLFALAALYVFMARGSVYGSVMNPISCPLAIIGALFLASWGIKKMRPPPHA